MEQWVTIDKLIRPQERVVWQDLAARPGSRVYRPRFRREWKDWWLPLAFVCAAIIVSTWFAFEQPDDLLANLTAPLALVALLLLIVAQYRQEQRYFQKAELHYVLTNERLIIHDATYDFTMEIFPGGLTRLDRYGRNIDLYMKKPADAHTLADLADPDEAQRLISQILGLEK